MAIIKTWRVTAQHESLQERSSSPPPHDQYVTVEAHQLTIEPSGALSFWAVTPDNMQSILLFGFAPHAWSRVAVIETVKKETPA